MKTKPHPRTRPAKRGRATDPTMRLYRAVCRYIESKGGNVLVARGIEIHHEERKHTFKVAVLCMGKKPDFAAVGLLSKGKKT